MPFKLGSLIICCFWASDNLEISSKNTFLFICLSRFLASAFTCSSFGWSAWVVVISLSSKYLTISLSIKLNTCCFAPVFQLIISVAWANFIFFNVFPFLLSISSNFLSKSPIEIWNKSISQSSFTHNVSEILVIEGSFISSSTSSFK